MKCGVWRGKREIKDGTTFPDLRNWAVGVATY